MNPNNTCTLEASQRLVAAGIVLETVIPLSALLWQSKYERQ
jgi:hypothetical protein